MRLSKIVFVLLAFVTITASASAQVKKPLLIDSHMHVWSGDPGRFPFSHPYDAKFKPAKTAATVELLLEEMEQFGVSHCVLVQTISHGWDNRYLVECVKKSPKKFKGQGLIGEGSIRDMLDCSAEQAKTLIPTVPFFDPTVFRTKDKLDWRAKGNRFPVTAPAARAEPFRSPPGSRPKQSPTAPGPVDPC